MTWTVADVMTQDPVTIGPATTFKACVKLMRVHEVSAVPVVDRDNRLLGIVSESDLLAREAERSERNRPEHAGVVKAGASAAAALMSRDVVSTTTTSPLAAAASLMFQHHLKVLPVVDSEHRVVGLVSRAQVLKVFLRSDESIRKEVVRDVLGEVEVEVREGVVHLYGVDETDSRTEAACRKVMGIPGVVGVKTHLNPASEPEPAEMEPVAGRHA
jgi:CBS-domain-containing membrane protein